MPQHCPIIVTVLHGHDQTGACTLMAYLGTAEQPHVRLLATLDKGYADHTPGVREAWDAMLERVRADAEPKVNALADLVTANRASMRAASKPHGN
jgi:hypothetical protein